MHAAQELVGFDELDPRLNRTVFWGFLWRAFVATVCSAIAGAIVGGVLGFLWGLVGAAVGAPPNLALLRILGAVAGLAIGLIAWWMYVRWLFSARFGGLRLRLAREATVVV